MAKRRRNILKITKYRTPSSFRRQLKYKTIKKKRSFRPNPPNTS